MDEAPPFDYRPQVAAEVQPLLLELMATALGWVQA
jgi:N-formylglutamate deformylase